MSRRPPNPAADRAAQNQQTLKGLVKLEGNKSCADCKRNKHPRWASWNLGVFICIRCSGIHRGMGTHISRVKSVDLDAWTDEQMQSILRWGNSRANKYWEAKLAPGHVPSEAKIENFIRTKYESKRWVMDGGMPDPSTLDGDGDEDVPLSVVQEQQKRERPSSANESPSPNPPGQLSKPPTSVGLFNDDLAAASRPGAIAQPPAQATQKSAIDSNKSAKQGDSLLGLDFFNSSAPQSLGTARSASTPANSQTAATQSRPDLKQSILSLYASAPRQQASTQQSHIDVQAPSISHSTPSLQKQGQQSDAFASLNNSFAGLSFSNPTSPQPQQQPASPMAFSPFGDVHNQKATPAAPQITPSTSIGGGFFSSSSKSAGGSSVGPKFPSPDATQFTSGVLGTSGVGSRDKDSTSAAVTQKPSSELDNLFGFSAAPPSQVTSKQSASPSGQPSTSVFNLSASEATAQNKRPSASTGVQAANLNSVWSNTDAWGSNDAWSSTTNTATMSGPASGLTVAPIAPASTSATEPGWGMSPTDAKGGFQKGHEPKESLTGMPKITADEEFGGWTSASPVTANSGAKPSASGSGGLGGGDDLFSNVWE